MPSSLVILYGKFLYVSDTKQAVYWFVVTYLTFYLESKILLVKKVDIIFASSCSEKQHFKRKAIKYYICLSQSSFFPFF